MELITVRTFYKIALVNTFYFIFASTVTIVGGVVFLAFALSALFIKPETGF